jgi:rod shape-determining protein MreD
MKPSVWFRLDGLVRKLTPFLLTLILVLVSIVPLHIPGLSRVVPLLPLIAIYHWAVYRSELLPAWTVFIIGVLHDIFTGAPIGANAFVFLLVYGLVVSQHRFLFGKSFAVIWIGFGLVSGAASALMWFLVSAWNVAVIEPSAIYVQFLLTFGLFPGIAWLFQLWQRAFLRQI